jgi:hypothetical protein
MGIAVALPASVIKEGEYHDHAQEAYKYFKKEIWMCHIVRNYTESKYASK